MDEEDVVYIKLSDKSRGDVLFEGKVSTDIEPGDLLSLGCSFLDRGLGAIYNKTSNEQVRSFKGLQNNVEVVAGLGLIKEFSGVLYIDADDRVLRKSKSVPSCKCVTLSVWYLSHEECEKVFKCETLEVLEIVRGSLRQVPREIGGMKKLRKLSLFGLEDLQSLPEEMGDLSSLEDFWIWFCVVESLPKRLKDLRLLKSIELCGLRRLQLCTEDFLVFSRLKKLTISSCKWPRASVSFWEMIKSTTDLGFLSLEEFMYEQDQEVAVAALRGNGSIVDGRGKSEHKRIFKRNKSNHKRARNCVLRLLAIRRCRNVLKNVPKEMVKMIAVMLWNTRMRGPEGQKSKR